MEGSRKAKFAGIANFFEASELKTWFLKFIQLIIVVEVFIFAMILVIYAANRPAPFPIKLYLFLAFCTPLAITFLLGAIIQAFGRYIYGDGHSAPAHVENGDGNGRLSPASPAKVIWARMTTAPYMAKLALLLAAVFFFYYLDDVVAFVAGAGMKVFDSMMTLALTLTGGITLLGLIWIVAVFRLKQKQMAYHYQYRKDILERLELMVLDDDTIIDKSGNIVPVHSSSEKTLLSLEDQNNSNPKILNRR